MVGIRLRMGHVAAVAALSMVLVLCGATGAIGDSIEL